VTSRNKKGNGTPTFVLEGVDNRVEKLQNGSLGEIPHQKKGGEKNRELKSRLAHWEQN